MTQAGSRRRRRVSPGAARTAWVVFTDLDGTLLDSATYSFGPARPALRSLREAGIPLVPCTSKTRAEMEPLRRALGVEGPAIIENGGGILEADGSLLALGPAGSRMFRAYDRLKQSAGGVLRAFHEMSDSELSAETGLSRVEAERARRREFDIPFAILGDSSKVEPVLARAAAKLGLRITRGGRYFHLHGLADKGKALHRVMRRYRGRRAVAIGDSANDLPMLKAAHLAFAVMTRSGKHDPDLVKGIPKLRLVDRPGPEGWRIAVEQLLEESGIVSRES